MGSRRVIHICIDLNSIWISNLYVTDKSIQAMGHKLSEATGELMEREQIAICNQQHDG